MASGVFGFLELLWRGFQLVGAGLVGAIRFILGLFNLSVPDWMIQIATVLVLLVVVFRYGKFISKILLVILLLLLSSTLINALLLR